MTRWPIKPLKEFIEEQTTRLGKGSATIYSVTNDRGFIRSLDVFDKRVFSESTHNYKRVGLHSLAYNPSRINVGSIAICEDKDGGAVSPMYVVVRCKPELIPHYLLYFLKSEAGQHHIKNRCEGAVRFQLKFKHLCEIPMPMPPVQEQKRILKILDEAAALRKLRAESDSRTATLIPALFHEMFGNIGNTKWPTKQISEVCELVRGSSPRPKSDPRYYGGAIPRLMIEDITRDGWNVTPKVDSLTELGAQKSRPVKAGTIVMAVSGNIGLCAQLQVDACIHDGFVAFTNLNQELLDPTYFGYTLSLMRETHKKNQAGAIFQNITTTDVKSTCLPLPPLALQKKFSIRVAKIKKLTDIQTACRHNMHSAFQSLLHYAFNGNL